MAEPLFQTRLDARERLDPHGQPDGASADADRGAIGLAERAMTRRLGMTERRVELAQRRTKGNFAPRDESRRCLNAASQSERHERTVAVVKLLARQAVVRVAFETRIIHRFDSL